MVEFLVENLPLALTAAGLVMMAMEALSPGAHLIVIGVALLGAGVIGMLFPPAAAPLVLAALVLVIGGAATWVYREFDFYGGKGTAQTSDSTSLAGRTGYVTETVTQRGGRVKLDSGGFNPHYSARTRRGTIEEGEEVIVMDPGGGNVLTVETSESFDRDEIDRELEREAEKEGAASPDELDDDTVSETLTELAEENESDPTAGSDDGDADSTVERATETEETR